MHHLRGPLELELVVKLVGPSVGFGKQGFVGRWMVPPTLTLSLTMCSTSRASFKFDHRRKQSSIASLPFKTKGYSFLCNWNRGIATSKSGKSFSKESSKAFQLRLAFKLASLLLRARTCSAKLVESIAPSNFSNSIANRKTIAVAGLALQLAVTVSVGAKPRGLSVETFMNNRRFLMVFPLLTVALSTPPDIWCQIIARFLISLIIELTIFVETIAQVREEAGRVE
ncbi:hypothetical protein KIW84_065800 [Lathyrus oleraceus]|uniref:Uncharacterized protein n=1 Tax=Pisum sativum TaxID=3888 RepID=A0A9D4WFC3_PEA|nr:hypothetical protein KIW84_065800 [Pisum sativum]